MLALESTWMSDWKDYIFSEFVDINPSVALRRGELYSFVEMKDLNDGQRACAPSAERILSGGARFQERDTLFARITPCLENGKICQVRNLKGGVGFGSTEFLVFRGKEGVSDNDFVYYLSCSPEVRSFAESNFDGTSGRQRVPKDCFDKLVLRLPDLDTQRKIAEILSSLDDKIDLLQRQNKTLEAMAETLFRQWFVEEAEEDSEMARIGSIAKIQSGFAFKSQAFRDTGKYKVITIKNVQDGYLDSGKTAMLNNPSKGVPDHCYIQPGDILLSLTGNVGRCCLVDESDLLLNQRVGKVTPLDNRDWAFAYVLFRLASTRRMLEELAKGTAQANLSPIETEQLEIEVPSMSRREKYSLHASPILNKVLRNKIQIRTLEKLRVSLLPQLLSGCLNIKAT